MAHNVENLMLEHLKPFQATLDGMALDLRELKVRQADTYTAVVGLRRDPALGAEVSAHLAVRADAMGDRLDRIERRLELKD